MLCCRCDGHRCRHRRRCRKQDRQTTPFSQGEEGVLLVDLVGNDLVWGRLLMMFVVVIVTVNGSDRQDDVIVEVMVVADCGLPI